MFIRENKTYHKKNGNTYIKHKLVESKRTEAGVRQNVIMGLGKLDIPRRDWKKLAHALESILTGQESLLSDKDRDIWDLAESLVSNSELSKSIQKRATVDTSEGCQLLTVDVGSIQTMKTRSVGAELSCEWAWKQLGMQEILKKCGFSKRETALARTVIFGRMISPGSERHTHKWFRKRSALSEMPGTDISDAGKNSFYEIGDLLYDQKEQLESLLYESGRKLYPDGAATIFLYDLTNTYMEGSCLGNTLAERGHCKSKRTDCPLITLSLVVDGDGAPVVSHIYEGNQSEPETMPKMIERIEQTLWCGQQTIIKPTIAMDRGIATKDNVAYLKENGYPYVVIRREDESDCYREIFESEKDAFDIVSSHVSAYGDECNVYVKKLEQQDGIAKVLCISDGKAHKAEAIEKFKEDRLLDKITNLDKSIKKGTIKKVDKILAKVEKIKTQHKTVSQRFDINTILDGKTATGVSAERKPETEKKLYGCYVLETTHTEMTGSEIWKLYMTLTRVENAFRMMKSELGVRPVYHQKAERASAHLFISVLAYHLLSIIERKLLEQGDNRCWDTIRETLATHTRCTVVMKDEDGHTHHVRMTGRPEAEHLDIYNALGICDFLPNVAVQIE